MCLITMFFFGSCIGKKNQNNDASQIIENIIESKKDSIYSHPDIVRDYFENELLPSVNDSTDYYKLKLFISYCDYLAGNTLDIENVNKDVFEYCSHNEEDKRVAALQALAYNHKGVFYMYDGRRDSALANYKGGISHAYRAEDGMCIINLCINVADMYRQGGELVESSRYYRQAFKVADSLSIEEPLFSICTGLGQIYADLRNFELSDMNFDMAINDIENRSLQEKHFFYNSLGNRFYFENKYDSALVFFRKSYVESLNIKNPIFKTIVECNIGEIFSLLGINDSARYYLDKANVYISGMNPPDEGFRFYINSLYTYLEIKEGHLDKARNYLDQKYDMAVIGPSYIYLHNKRMMEFYEKKNDLKNAYPYYKEVIRYDDSLRNIQNLRNIAEADLRYSQDTAFLHQNIIIAEGKVSESRLKMTILFIVILLLLVIAVTSAVIRTLRKNARIRYSRQMEQLTELRMENVRNRVSPHFMFNVINTLMPSFGEREELARPLNLFVSVIRENLRISESLTATLSSEIDLVKNFIELRRISGNHTPDVVWNISSDIPMSAEILSMIIQIPVENALKYAFVGIERDNNQIIIDMSLSDGYINIRISDNGRGFVPTAFAGSGKGTGNGLKMLYKTISMLNARNTYKIEFNISDISSSGRKGRGTLVTADIPVIYNYYYQKERNIV